MSSHKQQLEGIVQRFSATHVLWRRNIQPNREEVWEIVFKENNDIVNSIEELHMLKRNNKQLYDVMMGRFRNAFTTYNANINSQYPEKIYVSIDLPNRESNIDYHAIACNANLVYFDGKFYGKNTNGQPNDRITYSLTHAPKIEDTEIIGAINQLAQAILDTY
uniref:Uncharacterized protein n=1 Tax=Megaviridae environmental sample TaxID=1737588 RepID=A0A5J6VKS2_9VIRU|nr:MAG: hypothetical protein [Megaviridae environmental sample]